MELTETRVKLHENVLRLRAIERLIRKEKFESLFAISGIELQARALQFIEAQDLDGLLNWMSSHPAVPYHEKSLTELRGLCKQHVIPNYSRLTKQELIRRLEKDDLVSSGMMPEMADMVTRVPAFFHTMLPIIMEAGIRETYLSCPDDLTIIPQETVTEGYIWLRDLYANEYTKVMAIKKLLPEATWRQYANWGLMDEHQESVELKARLVILKEAVRKSRPFLFSRLKMRRYKK